MGFATITTGAFAVLAGCTAAYNLWLYSVRPRERAHLWLGVSALGVVGIGAGLALTYEARDLADAQFAQTLAFLPAPLLVTGFLRFTAVFLKVRIRTIEWVSGTFAAGFVLAIVYEPSWFFDGGTVESSVLGASYVMASFHPSVAFVFPGFLAMFGALAVLFGRHRHQFRDSGSMLGSIVLWGLTAANDIAVAIGLYQGPNLVTLGFLAFAMAFTGLLVRRFVGSVAQIEASAEALQQIVETKSQQLREKDHQLAHGSRMATVGAISAGLAQEIHQPVSAVATRLEELRGAFKDPAQADRFETLLGQCREGIDRIRIIVSDLLRISRRDASDEGAVCMVRAVESVLPIAQSEARTRAVIETHLEAVPFVHGSETLLCQVALNLIVNALHAIPEGNPEENTVTVRTSHEDGSVWLTVEDTSGGISNDRLAHLFDPFASGQSGDAGGSGLGLAVTHQLVGRHRGTIAVENGPHGARFIVELPPMAQPVDEEAADETAPGGGAV